MAEPAVAAGDGAGAAGRSRRGCCWQRLPASALRGVFGRLSPGDLAAAAASCRAWRDAAADDGVFRLLALAQTPGRGLGSAWASGEGRRLAERESGGRGAEGQWREAYKVRTRAGGLRQRRTSLLNYEFQLTVVARPAGGRAGRQARKRRLSLSAARESRRARLAELDPNDEALARLAGDGRAWQEAFHSPLARAPRALL